MLGKPQKMLVERILKDGTACGYGENYIPIRLKDNILQKNTFADVILKDIYFKGDNSEIFAEIIS